MIESYKYLVDSNIIIYHLNGEKIATDFLKENFQSSCISRLSFIEVLSFDFSKDEKQEVIRLLQNFNIIDTNHDIALKAIENRQNKKIKLVDNIIASTAQIFDLALVTRNVRDFTNLDVKLLDIFSSDS